MSLVPSVSVCGVCGVDGHVSWMRDHVRSCSKPVGGAGAAAPVPAPPAAPMCAALDRAAALRARREEALTRALARGAPAPVPAPPAAPMCAALDRAAALRARREEALTRALARGAPAPARTLAPGVSTSDAEHIKRLMDYHQRLGQSCFVSYALGGRQADGTWAVHSGSFGTTAFPFLLEMDRPSSFKNSGEAEAALFKALEAKFGPQAYVAMGGFLGSYEPRTLFHMRIGPYREAGGARDKADAAAAERRAAIEEIGELRKIGNQYYYINNDEVFTATKPRMGRVSHYSLRSLHARDYAPLTTDEIRSLRGPRAFATVKDAELATEMAEVMAEDARILAEAKRRLAVEEHETTRRLAEEARATAEAEREARIKSVMNSLRA